MTQPTPQHEAAAKEITNEYTQMGRGFGRSSSPETYRNDLNYFTSILARHFPPAPAPATPAPSEASVIAVECVSEIERELMRITVHLSEYEMELIARAVQTAIDRARVGVSEERDGLKKDRDEVMKMLNEAALECGFDGYDYETPLWRNFASHLDRYTEVFNKHLDALRKRVEEVEAAIDETLLPLQFFPDVDKSVLDYSRSKPMSERVASIAEWMLQQKQLIRDHVALMETCRDQGTKFAELERDRDRYLEAIAQTTTILMQVSSELLTSKDGPIGIFLSESYRIQEINKGLLDAARQSAATKEGV